MYMQRDEIKNKVAEVTLLFWLLKIVATTLGETLGDYISMTLNVGYTAGIVITAALFFLSLLIQMEQKKYIPVVFWSVIICTTTLGTEISDFIDRTLKLGYATGSLLLVSSLLITLYLWKKKYQNLEIYPIDEKTKELYFWIAILFSNSLGTAFGDFLSDNLGLTYLSGALITGCIILIAILLHFYTTINHTLLFWVAFIFTRPFGATFGDLLTKPLAKGGLDLGTLNASVVSLLIMIFLLYLNIRQLHKKRVFDLG